MANNTILISQKRYYMSLRDSGKKQRKSAYCSGISERTARRIDKNGIKKVVHNWRTRNDPLEEVWSKLESLLAEAPDLQPSTLLYYLQDEHPGKYGNNILRTLQRRVKDWKVLKGKDKEVMFLQKHHPGQNQFRRGSGRFW